ncbi:hypothetical protein GCM10007853_04390 [Algimonas ampicilliniresistens]|uniref:Sigma-70 family RNA polymerase sigma factor n=1 Tax=Algimonas ampicilliniresistens TaxID=1298735 RepID=A0ABQ5V7C8_9PROT|nr:hypothetical protein [Algimonas ampicilliniresistens]GLQ22565.1 hypothetical protein GCM10007853_04390 [Algimonas ampicilliniresistens]
MELEPLRMRNGQGVLYTRRAPVVAAIKRGLNDSFETLLERAKIRNRQDPDYVPSEALVYHIRRTKSDNSEARFIALLDIINKRVADSCRRPGRQVGNQLYEDAELAELREATVNLVMELILKDQDGYEKKLDVYEFAFDKAVRARRIDHKRMRGRRPTANAPILDEISGEVRQDVEDALARLSSGQTPIESSLDCRIALRRAIDTLPSDQREVVELWMSGVQIESKKDEEPSIATTLGCSIRTVQNRRNRAFAAMRVALGLENDDE